MRYTHLILLSSLLLTACGSDQQSATQPFSLQGVTNAAKNHYFGDVTPENQLKGYARDLAELLQCLSFNTSTGNATVLTKMVTAYAATSTDSANDKNDTIAAATEMTKINAYGLLYADTIEILISLCDRIEKAQIL